MDHTYDIEDKVIVQNETVGKNFDSIQRIHNNIFENVFGEKKHLNGNSDH